MIKLGYITTLIARADPDTLDAIEELCTLIATAARDRSALISERAKRHGDNKRFLATLPPWPADQRRADRARRDRLILRLYAQGLKYHQIGKRVGLSKQRVSEIIKGTTCREYTGFGPVPADGRNQ